jgi:hypothetical protein
MHIRWLTNDGVNGMVPIELAKDAIGLARACEIHGASFFANGARPGLVLSTDNNLSVDAAETLRVNWERVHRGPDRAQKTAVLTGGLKPVEFGNTNQESQFLETRRFQIEEVCRLYRVPPHLVGDLSRSTFANIEQQSIDFVQHTLLPWLRRFESAFHRDLFGDGDTTHFTEFDTRGFMRGDAAARASYYQTLHGLGVASVNELRAWENLNPVEGGDTRFTPLNMQTLEAAANQPPAPAPPPTPAASVNELVAVLSQIAAGSIAPEAAKSIMAAAFPALPENLASQIVAGVSGPEKPTEQPADRPAAEVGGLVTILAQVKEGGLTPDAAVAALGSVYPGLPDATTRQIVAGVNPPSQPQERPTADVGGLLAILGQVTQGAVTPEAALSIVTAVFPTMPQPLAQAIIAGAKQQQPPQQPPPGAPEGQSPFGPGGPPGAPEQPTSGPQDSRAFCPGASPPDNTCSPANKGDSAPRPPAAPEPSKTPVGDDDPRGKLTGHTAEQRLAYAKEVEQWLKEHHGIMLVEYGDFADPLPPSMHAMQLVTEGVPKIVELGMAKPEAIIFDDGLPPKAAAAFYQWNNSIAINPNFNISSLGKAKPGQFASNALPDVLVHESAHKQHIASIRDKVPSFYRGKDEQAVDNAASERVGMLFGNPDDDGFPTKDPWTKSARFGSAALNEDGKPVDPDEARSIAAKVSEYATTNPLEFVAEVVSGQSAGATYGDDVLSLYDDYGGPAELVRRGSRRRTA